MVQISYGNGNKFFFTQRLRAFALKIEAGNDGVKDDYKWRGWVCLQPVISLSSLTTLESFVLFLTLECSNQESMLLSSRPMLKDLYTPFKIHRCHDVVQSNSFCYSVCVLCYSFVLVCLLPSPHPLHTVSSVWSVFHYNLHLLCLSNQPHLVAIESSSQSLAFFDF